MKKTKIAILLVCCMALMLLPTASLAANESDWENHWSAPYIEKAIERNWMEGYPDGSMRPDGKITRAEFATLLWRALGEPAPTGKAPFKDLEAGSFYEKAVTALYEAEIVEGVGENRFAPDEFLTREEGITMLARAFKLIPESADTFQSFSDAGSVSSWAWEAFSALIEKGYVEGMGDNTLAPGQDMTRGEMAKLLVVIFDGEKEEPQPEKPTITLTHYPTSGTYGKVTVTAEVTGEKITFVGWQRASEGATFTDKSGFEDITAEKSFKVSSNGWYAACVEDAAGQFAYTMIRITNIRTSTGPTFYTLTYDANGGTNAPAESQYKLNETATVGLATNPPTDGNNRIFWEWNTAADGSGTPYLPGDTVTITGNMTLHAVYVGDPEGVNAADPIKISFPQQMGLITTVGEDKHYRLTSDITIADTWTPIADAANPFTGTFDGNGKTITMGSETDPVLIENVRYAGLFGYILGNGDGTTVNVKDLTVAGSLKVDYVGADPSCEAGSVAGVIANGVIEGCAVIASLDFSGSASNTSSDSAYVGGVVGRNLARTSELAAIRQCYTTGNVSASFNKTVYAGGIAGLNNGANPTNANPPDTPAGESTATVSQCYSTGNVSVESGGASSSVWCSAGGIVGFNYASGSSQGLAIFNDYKAKALIEECYATGNILSKVNDATSALTVGGIVGISESPSGVGASRATKLVTNCVALNDTVTATGSTNTNPYLKQYAARILPISMNSPKNCLAFENIQCAGITRVVTPGADLLDGADLSAASALVENTYVNDATISGTSLGWDFTDVWVMDDGTYKLPILRGSTEFMDAQRAQSLPAHLI